MTITRKIKIEKILNLIFLSVQPFPKFRKFEHFKKIEKKMFEQFKKKKIFFLVLVDPIAGTG